jgi:glycosyltransferase involved in cell wall biosynthesis
VTGICKDEAGGRIVHCTVSVVVPNYNHGRFLTQCLAAIEAQTVKPYEVLLIDDASTDDSLDVIDRFAARLPRFRLVRHLANQGVIASMNEGLRLASGTHVLFAAADDWIEPELIALSTRCLDRYPEAGICSALTRLANEDGVVTGPFRTPVPRWTVGYVTPAKAVRHLTRDDTWFNGNTSIINRAAAIDMGGYRSELASFCDGFLNANLAWRYGACFIPRFLAVWRRLETGYAASANVDASLLLGILGAMQRDVRTSTSRSIPEEYFERWLARWQFSAARAAIAPGAGERSKQLVSLLPANFRPVVKMLQQVTRVSGFGPKIATAFLFLLFRFRDIEPVVRRRLEWMVFGASKARRRR